MRRFRRFSQSEDGLETVEYAVIGGLITVGAVATLASIGGWVQGVFNSVLALLVGG